MGETLIKRLAKHDFYYNDVEQTIETLNHTTLLKRVEEGRYAVTDAFYNLTSEDRQVLLSILQVEELF